MKIQPLLLVLLGLTGMHAAGVKYVKPANASSSVCPQEPCRTLDQYIQSSFTTGSTFIFLPGRHTMLGSIGLRYVSNITLRGTGPNSKAIVVCSSKFTIICRNASAVNIKWLTFDMLESQWFTEINDPATVIRMGYCMDVTISECSFQGYGKFDAYNSTSVSALHAGYSNITIICRSMFQGNTGYYGGALYVTINTHLIVSESLFIENAAVMGGAIYVHNSTTLLTSNTQFLSNSVIMRNSIYDSKGGAIFLSSSTLIISNDVTFSNNTAVSGGALFLQSSAALFNGEDIVFFDNIAKSGGGIYIEGGSHIKRGKATFIGNHAKMYGGGLFAASDSYSNTVEIMSANFSNNSAESGGAVYASKKNLVNFLDLNMTRNSGSALFATHCELTFTGTTQIVQNVGKYGGGMEAEHCHVIFDGETMFGSNTARKGAAINLFQSEIYFKNQIAFSKNKALFTGGAVFATYCSIYLQKNLLANINSAVKGGVMFLKGTTMTLTRNSEINTYNNSASQYGGVIFIEDSPTFEQCSGASEDYTLPYCVLRSEYNDFGRIFSLYDSAGLDGRVLYGGLLDRCETFKKDTRNGLNQFLSEITSSVTVPNTTVKAISSEPYALCACNSPNDYKCFKNLHVEVFRGQVFSLYILALAQAQAAVPATITAVTHRSRLDTFQNIQSLPEGCAHLHYTLHSAESHDLMILYPDGPCKDKGLARLTVNVTFLPCPWGFSQSKESCICDERLRIYDVDCSIDSEATFTKHNNSKFWMGAMRIENASYKGLILYESCPMEYCKTEAVKFTLNELNTQCDLNRSGVLCGQCALNYSLMLGSSRCEICSDKYLLLLFAFAAAGIALVVFHSALKLTVSTGVLNSIIILYANIIQVNKQLFLPPQINPLTIFIAWLNLDFGIESCFYNGLTAYAQTWLQFVFPVYIWIIIGSIIIMARCSVTLSNFLGSNPVAVLATLLIMSYAKILRIIIEVYSFVDLDYPPDNVRVWIKDGNIPYLGSWHLFLLVVTTLVLVLLFLPYTFLLLLGHKLYPFTGRRYFHWLNRIKPFLETYYAPYKFHTRFWTGLLLLIRCILYIIFAIEFLGGTKTSLLALIVTFTTLAILGSGRIYKNIVINVVETYVYFNLVILSGATLAEYNWPVLVYILVGSVLIILLCAVVYQFHLLYIANTAIWLKLKTKASSVLVKKRDTLQECKTTESLTANSTQNVSKSVIELREPLLEVTY